MERRLSPSSSNSSNDSSPVKRQPQFKTQSSSPYTSSPVYEDERRSPRALSPPTTPAAPISELSYHHYQHYHHQQPQVHQPPPQQQSPHIRPQPRLLPSVFIPSHHVTQSPVAQGMTTSRLPPISMLTAAASLQPRMQRQTSSSSASALGLRASAPPAPRGGPARGPAASHTPANIHPDDQDNLCRYRNKRCGYPRAIKRNGDRHNLCEKHRAKANQNQRKLESKRRTLKKSPTTPRGGPVPNQQTQHPQHHSQPQHPQHPQYRASAISNGISAHESLQEAARRDRAASELAPLSPAYPPHRGMSGTIC